MAFTFVDNPVATLTGTLINSTKQINIPGCNVDETSGDNAVLQANKLLAVAGKEIVADEKLTLDPIKKGVVEE